MGQTEIRNSHSELWNIDNPCNPLLGLGLDDEKTSLVANFWNSDATKANKISHRRHRICGQSGIRAGYFIKSCSDNQLGKNQVFERKPSWNSNCSASIDRDGCMIVASSCDRFSRDPRPGRRNVPLWQPRPNHSSSHAT
jgi:hypothetical protein